MYKAVFGARGICYRNGHGPKGQGLKDGTQGSRAGEGRRTGLPEQEEAWGHILQEVNRPQGGSCSSCRGCPAVGAGRLPSSPGEQRPRPQPPEREKQTGGQDGCSQQLSLHPDSLPPAPLSAAARRPRSSGAPGGRRGQGRCLPLALAGRGWGPALRTAWFQEREGEGLRGSFTTTPLFTE